VHLGADLRHAIALSATGHVPGQPLERARVSAGEFLNAYIPVERTLRDLAERERIDPTRHGLRRVVDMLVAGGTLPAELGSQLEELILYRNNVVHGVVEAVPSSSVRWAREVARALARDAGS
jgi:hypothetical protein